MLDKPVPLPRKPLDSERVKSVIDVVTAGLNLQKVIILGVDESGNLTVFPSNFNGPVEMAGILEAAKFSILSTGRQP